MFQFTVVGEKLFEFPAVRPFFNGDVDTLFRILCESAFYKETQATVKLLCDNGGKHCDMSGSQFKALFYVVKDGLTRQMQGRSGLWKRGLLWTV